MSLENMAESYHDISKFTPVLKSHSNALKEATVSQHLSAVWTEQRVHVGRITAGKFDRVVSRHPSADRTCLISAILADKHAHIHWQ